MNLNKTLEDFRAKNILTASSIEKIKNYEQQKPLSLYWELRSVLYVGITLFSTSIGILIYKNIETIGHTALIAIISLLCILAFGYSLKNRLPFTTQEQTQDKAFDEFIILLACLLFLTLEAYLQYQYEIFGTKYGIATFLPMLLFFVCAYLFDHRGILSMAITALASWVGVNITPKEVFAGTQFLNGQLLTHTAIGLGIFLVVLGWLSVRQDFKKHFAFSYWFLGGNLAFASSLSGLFLFDIKTIYLLIISILSIFFYLQAQKQKSFMFMLMAVIYSYIAVSYLILKNIPDLSIELSFFYFTLSSAGVVYLLISLSKQSKK